MHNSNTYIYANPTLREHVINAVPYVWNHGQLKRLVLTAYKTGDVHFVDDVVTKVMEYHRSKPYFSRLHFDDPTLHRLRPRYLPRAEFLRWVENNKTNPRALDITCYNSIIQYYEGIGLRRQAEEYLQLAIDTKVFTNIFGTSRDVRCDRGSELAHVVATGLHHKEYIDKSIREKLKGSEAVYINLTSCDHHTIATALRVCFRALRDRTVSPPKQLAIQLTAPHDRHRTNNQPGKTLYVQPWCEKLPLLRSRLRRFIPSAFTRIPKSPYVIYYTQAQTEYILRKLPHCDSL
uniref:Uncharacterized protein n=1 Tax=Lygus hesperus TaxID=30085 RepID=A0A146LK82_LYGHE